MRMFYLTWTASRDVEFTFLLSQFLSLPSKNDSLIFVDENIDNSFTSISMDRISMGTCSPLPEEVDQLTWSVFFLYEILFFFFEVFSRETNTPICWWESLCVLVNINNLNDASYWSGRSDSAFVDLINQIEFLFVNFVEIFALSRITVWDVAKTSDEYPINSNTL